MAQPVGCGGGMHLSLCNILYNSTDTHAILIKLCPSEQNVFLNILKLKWLSLHNPLACTKWSYLKRVTFYRPKLHSIDVANSNPFYKLYAACWNTNVLLSFCVFTRRYVIILHFMLLSERLTLDVHPMH